MIAEIEADSIIDGCGLRTLVKRTGGKEMEEFREGDCFGGLRRVGLRR